MFFIKPNPLRFLGFKKKPKLMCFKICMGYQLFTPHTIKIPMFVKS